MFCDKKFKRSQTETRQGDYKSVIMLYSFRSLQATGVLFFAHVDIRRMKMLHESLAQHFKKWKKSNQPPLLVRFASNFMQLYILKLFSHYVFEKIK
jgi:hypothetical protein